MLVSTIDQSLFERIKFEQSLNVSFIDFVQHLHKILDSATKRSDLHASLNTNLNCITLQFFERRSFRNLVHLSLPIEEPSERFVLHHMLHSLAAAQHKSDANALQLQRIQLDLSQRDAQCNDLRLELAAQSARLHDEQQRQHSHHAERTQRLEAELKNAHDAREADDRKHRQVVKTLQNALDAKTREEQVTAERLAAEAKRSELTRVEAQQIRHELRIAHEETERARTEMTAQKTIAGRLEQQLTESRDGERRARNEVLAQEKQRSELQAELEAEKHIARTKRMALELATEEISRANSIIVRQAKELGAVVKKCEWRTEVALKQEQRMKKLEEELVALQSRLRRNVEANEDNENVGGELKQLREATDQMNRKYGRSECDFCGKVN